MSERWEYAEYQDGESGPETGQESGRAGLGDDAAFPWPPAQDEPILPAFGATWKAATFDPGRFFPRTPRDGGTGAAILYYLALGILVAGAALFWNSLSVVSDPMAGDPMANQLGFQPLSPLAAFLLSPAYLLLGLAIAAGVVHVMLLIFDGATHGFGTTVRVYCYAASPTLFGVVPILGTIVGSLWSLVLLIIGLREAHEAAAWKPVVAVLVPFVLVVGFLMLVFLTALITLGGLVPGGG